MKSPDNYKVIGVMSGTSLDGMDIALCKFSFKKKWKFKILDATTLPYSARWKERLSSAHLLSGNDLTALDAEFGALIGKNSAQFIKKRKIGKIDAIASHGHTVFHQTDRKLTFQLGDGNAIFAGTGIPVIYDFRRLDVALGGEGAPLVPAGDLHLFDKFEVCLNLGGIANLSTGKSGKRIAYDLCHANMGLNYLANKDGKSMDEHGALAASGSINVELLKNLSSINRSYHNKRPSLGRETFERDIRTFLDDEAISIADRLRTFCESIAQEINESIPKGKLKIMATGGGAHNSFLIEAIRRRLKKASIILPSDQIIEFKEAMVFAFLGVLRLRSEINVLKTVTRATKDSCSGVLVGVKTKQQR